jgi:parallel beta-helix repeat protein
MKKPRSVHLWLLAAAVSLLLSVVSPMTHAPPQVAGQTSAPTIELVYDDGLAWKKISQSIGGCEACYTYQGVRFDIGGARQAVLTTVRLYAGDPSGILEVTATNEACDALLFDPIQVAVSKNPEWHTVTVPETMLTGDFFVWVKKDGSAMPWHDGGTTSKRSYHSEHWNPTVFPHQRLTRGDLMIRASIRAEIHVGVGQDYATIQEAVDAASEGMLIIVHEGTYNENVLVNKQLSIMTQDGPSSTFVTPPNPAVSAFTVTADGVIISGFSIQGASGSGAAGIYVEGASDCTLADNSISGNHYGVLTSAASRSNVVVQNHIHSNVYGVWVEGEKNNIAGNHIEENTAPVGSGVYFSAFATDTWVHFNSFSSAAGMDQAPQAYNDGTVQTANCVNNWWGSASGPHPTGTGAAVGEGIRFTPWLTAEPVAVKTATTAPGNYLLDGRAGVSTSVSKIGTGTPTVWIARYATNPGGEFPKTAIGNWTDVYINDTANFDQMEIRMYYTQAEVAAVKEGSLRLYWWDGSKWKVCSRSGVSTKDGYVSAKLSLKSTPSLAGLAGTPFVMGTTSAGFAWWWILVGIGILILVLVIVRLVFRVLSRRQYYEEAS